mmetsp:Transcript_19689/g.25951  ORF Transcript_19689/g.25951 Transcript_19689/m.25951 type:complete len:649 (+) Transcript_19689:199-2145(+)
MGAGASVDQQQRSEVPTDVPNSDISSLFLKIKDVFNQEVRTIRERHPDVTSQTILSRLFASHFAFEATDDGGVDLECSWKEENKGSFSKKGISPQRILVSPRNVNPNAAEEDYEASSMSETDAIGSFTQRSIRLSIVGKVGNKTVFNPKVVKLFGEAAAAGPKAHKILGDERTPKEIQYQNEQERRMQERIRAELMQQANAMSPDDRPTTGAGLTKPPSKKALEFMGDDDLDYEASKMKVAEARPGKKAALLAGESVVAGKAAYKILGDDMSQGQLASMKEANEREKAEAEIRARKELQEILLMDGPQEEQKILNAHEIGPISQKAIETMGDEELEELAKSLVPIGLRNEKLAKLSGESVVAGRKVHQWLGSGMTQEQIEAMHVADQKMASEQEAVMQEEIKKLLKTGISPEQIKLAQHEMYGVSDKALKMMGSEELVEEAKQLIPKGTKSKKMAQLTGESGMAGKKVRKRLGSDMTEEQVKQFLHAEMVEKKKSDKQSKAELEKMLRYDLTEEDEMDISNDAMVNEKVLKLMDDERLEEEAKKIIPKKVKNSKLAKMSGEAQMAGSKVRARLGSGMHEEQCRAAREAIEREEQERERARMKELEDILHTVPSTEQLQMSYTPSEKAMKKLGGVDDQLLAKSMKQKRK